MLILAVTFSSFSFRYSDSGKPCGTRTERGQFATAGKALQTWNTYPTAEGVKEGAEAGSKRIQPFVSKAAATAKNKLTPFFDPDNTNVIPSFYAVLAGVNSHDQFQMLPEEL